MAPCSQAIWNPPRGCVDFVGCFILLFLAIWRVPRSIFHPLKQHNPLDFGNKFSMDLFSKSTKNAEIPDE